MKTWVRAPDPMEKWYVPVALALERQRNGELWDSLASQPRPLSKLEASEWQFLDKSRGRVLKNDSQV